MGSHRLFFNKNGEYEGEILNSEGDIIGTLTLTDKNSRYFNIRTLKGSDQ